MEAKHLEGSPRSGEAKVGSWDVNTFSNDQAKDWLGTLITSNRSENIFRALVVVAKMPEEEYLQAPECEHALAAAELVAAAAGKASNSLPDSAKGWLSIQKNFVVGGGIVDMALKAVNRIAFYSELKELWQDTDSYRDWVNVVEDLQNRLRTSPAYSGGAEDDLSDAGVTDVNVLFEAAVQMISTGKHRRALAKYDRALLLDPESQLGHLGRGTCNLTLGQYRTAVDDFSKAIKLGSSVPEAYYLRAQAYFQLSQFEKTILDTSKLIGEAPENADAYWVRGLAYESLDQYMSAVNDFTRVIELNSAHKQAYLHRAGMYDKLGEELLARKDKDAAEALAALMG